MRLIWTKSNLPLSKMIRWLLDEPVSHFGIVFDNGIVFHSNLLGVHLDWYKHFETTCDIVYNIEMSLSLQEEELIYLNILNKYTGKPYDFKALFYFAYRALLLKLFNKGLPTKNEWEDSGALLCTELAGVLPSSILPNSVSQEDLAIISPFKLYCQFKM